MPGTQWAAALAGRSYRGTGPAPQRVSAYSILYPAGGLGADCGRRRNFGAAANFDRTFSCFPPVGPPRWKTGTGPGLKVKKWGPQRVCKKGPAAKTCIRPLRFYWAAPAGQLWADQTPAQTESSGGGTGKVCAFADLLLAPDADDMHKAVLPKLFFTVWCTGEPVCGTGPPFAGQPGRAA